MSAIRPFHLAIPVHDLEIAREFYGDILGCSTGRESENWIDFNFFGHQLVAHLVPANDSKTVTGRVDGEMVPPPSFWRNINTGGLEEIGNSPAGK